MQILLDSSNELLTVFSTIKNLGYWEMAHERIGLMMARIGKLENWRQKKLIDGGDVQEIAEWTKGSEIPEIDYKYSVDDGD
uniref:Phage portal protein n=1 Tax=Ascaris lumbricoides TaxID=6252 RepID=A0A0M3I0D3_ASCLU